MRASATLPIFLLLASLQTSETTVKSPTKTYINPPQVQAEINGYIEDTTVAQHGLLPWAPAWLYSVAGAFLPIRWQREVLPGIPLRLDGERQAAQFTLSNGAGRFHFGQLAPGAYRLSISGLNLTLPPDVSTVRLTSGETVDVYLSPLIDQSLTGQILLHSGIPATGVQLELISPAKLKMRAQGYVATTYGAGAFEFSGVVPGDYYLGVNLTTDATFEARYPRWFYPGVGTEAQATVLHLAPGSRAKVIHFQLPLPRPGAFEMCVSMVWPDGHPVQYAEVQVSGSTEPQQHITLHHFDPVRGTFSFTAFPDAKDYWVQCWASLLPLSRRSGLLRLTAFELNRRSARIIVNAAAY